MAYHTFKDEQGNEHGSFEVFYAELPVPLDVNEDCGSCGAALGPCSDGPWHAENEDCRAVREPTHGPGWYWWACFPGCLPDGEPSGPFATEQEAIDNAQEGA